MIVARAPFRITFGSGVVDVAARARGENAPGLSVLSATLDKWVYATAHLRTDRKIVVGYSRRETVDAPDQLENRLAAAVLRRADFLAGVELHFVSELPIDASGMGGSAAATCAALVALYAMRGMSLDPAWLAEHAAAIEIADLGRPVGRQDHVAAAYGGFARLTFTGDRFARNAFPRDSLDFLEDHATLLPCMDGASRDASAALAGQAEAANATGAADRLARLADLAESAVRARKADLLASVLNEAWDAKRALGPGVSSPAADALVAEVRVLGGGAKLCGAGGGGYVLAVLPDPRAARALAERPGSVPVRFGRQGAHVVYDSGERSWLGR